MPNKPKSKRDANAAPAYPTVRNVASSLRTAGQRFMGKPKATPRSDVGAVRG